MSDPTDALAAAFKRINGYPDEANRNAARNLIERLPADAALVTVDSLAAALLQRTDDLDEYGAWKYAAAIIQAAKEAERD